MDNKDPLSNKDFLERKSLSVKDPRHQSKALAQFLKTKDIAPTKALNDFGPEVLGEEHWLIGLIGIFQKPNLEDAFLRKIINDLFFTLNKQHEEDSIHINFIVEAFKQKAPFFDKNITNCINKFVEKHNLLNHNVKKVRFAAEMILTLTNSVKEDILYSKKVSETVVMEIEKKRKGIISTSHPEKIVEATTTEVTSTSAATRKAGEVIKYIIFVSMQTGINELGSSSLLLYPLLTRKIIERKINLIFKKTRLKSQAAIITHPGLVYSTKLKAYPHITFCKTETIHYIRSFFEQFIERLDAGYNSILVFLPHSGFWPYYVYAKHGAQELGHYVSVFDTQTFGAGMSIIIEEVCAYLKQNNDVHQVSYLIENLYSRLNFFIFPNNLKTWEDKFWFMKLKNKNEKELKNAEISPIISLAGKLNLIKVLSNPQKAANFLIKHIKYIINQKGIIPKRAIITHHENNSTALKLGKTLRAIYPNCEISIFIANKNIISEFGQHVSLAII
ncbi:DegV family protein [Candidatus Margulisiibacteriota bacterium]